jgi:hypothetical protein
MTAPAGVAAAAAEAIPQVHHYLQTTAAASR